MSSSLQKEKKEQAESQFKAEANKMDTPALHEALAALNTPVTYNMPISELEKMLRQKQNTENASLQHYLDGHNKDKTFFNIVKARICLTELIKKKQVASKQWLANSKQQQHEAQATERLPDVSHEYSHLGAPTAYDRGFGGAGKGSRGTVLVNQAKRPNPSTVKQITVSGSGGGGGGGGGYGHQWAPLMSNQTTTGRSQSIFNCPGCSFDCSADKMRKVPVSGGVHRLVCEGCEPHSQSLRRPSSEEHGQCCFCKLEFNIDDLVSLGEKSIACRICVIRKNANGTPATQQRQQQRQQQPQQVGKTNFYSTNTTTRQTQAPKLKTAIADVNEFSVHEYKIPLPSQKKPKLPAARVLQPPPQQQQQLIQQQQRSTRARQQSAWNPPRQQRLDGTEENPINLADTDDDGDGNGDDMDTEDAHRIAALRAVDLHDKGERRRTTRLTSGTINPSVVQRLAGLRCLMPPEGGSGAVEFTAADLARIAHDEFLNDTAIDYYLRWIRRELERTNPQDAERCYFFNSFFYKKLSEKHGGVLPPGVQEKGKTIAVLQAMKNYSKVKNWTRNVDIFSKDFIFVPIHDHLHWSLLVICHPGAELPATGRRPRSSSGGGGGGGSNSGGGKCGKASQSSAADVVDLSSNNPVHGSGENGTTKEEKEEEEVDPRVRPRPETFFLHLDSLKSGHASKAPTLAVQQYLQQEWQSKSEDPEAPVDSVPKLWTAAHSNEDGSSVERTFKGMKCIRPIVPIQDNHCDCGLFVCAFVEYFVAALPPALSYAAVDALRTKRTDGVDLWEGSSTCYPGFLTQNWFKSENASNLRWSLTVMVLEDMARFAGLLGAEGDWTPESSRISQSQVSDLMEEIENAKNVCKSEGEYRRPDEWKLQAIENKSARAEIRRRRLLQEEQKQQEQQQKQKQPPKRTRILRNSADVLVFEEEEEEDQLSGGGDARQQQQQQQQRTFNRKRNQKIIDSEDEEDAISDSDDDSDFKDIRAANARFPTSTGNNNTKKRSYPDAAAKSTAKTLRQNSFPLSPSTNVVQQQQSLSNNRTRNAVVFTADDMGQSLPVSDIELDLSSGSGDSDSEDDDDMLARAAGMMVQKKNNNKKKKKTKIENETVPCIRSDDDDDPLLLPSFLTQNQLRPRSHNSSSPQQQQQRDDYFEAPVEVGRGDGVDCLDILDDENEHIEIDDDVKNTPLPPADDMMNSTLGFGLTRGLTSAATAAATAAAAAAAVIGRTGLYSGYSAPEFDSPAPPVENDHFYDVNSQEGDGKNAKEKGEEEIDDDDDDEVYMHRLIDPHFDAEMPRNRPQPPPQQQQGSKKQKTEVQKVQQLLPLERSHLETLETLFRASQPPPRLAQVVRLTFARHSNADGSGGGGIKLEYDDQPEMELIHVGHNAFSDMVQWYNLWGADLPPSCQQMLPEKMSKATRKGRERALQLQAMTFAAAPGADDDEVNHHRKQCGSDDEVPATELQGEDDDDDDDDNDVDPDPEVKSADRQQQSGAFPLPISKIAAPVPIKAATTPLVPTHTYFNSDGDEERVDDPEAEEIEICTAMEISVPQHHHHRPSARAGHIDEDEYDFLERVAGESITPPDLKDQQKWGQQLQKHKQQQQGLNKRGKSGRGGGGRGGGNHQHVPMGARTEGAKTTLQVTAILTQSLKHNSGGKGHGGQRQRRRR